MNRILLMGSSEELRGKGYYVNDISGNSECGKGISSVMPEVAPSRELYEAWRSHKLGSSDEENNRRYAEEYYDQVLSRLDPEKVLDKLMYGGIHVSNEGYNEFSHRKLLGAWLDLLLSSSENAVVAREIKSVGVFPKESDDFSDDNDTVSMMEEIMKSRKTNMRGFTCLRALYLYEKGEDLEALADKLEEENPDKCYDGYRQSACYYRCDADEAEADYRRERRQKVKKSEA